MPFGLVPAVVRRHHQSLEGRRERMTIEQDLRSDVDTGQQTAVLLGCVRSARRGCNWSRATATTRSSS